MSRKRITKKQLKEDAFVSATFEAGHFIQEHLTKLILGTVGVLALAGVVWLFINYRFERRQDASLAMFKAEGLYMNGQFALAAADFEKLIGDYSGTEQARKAEFFAGDSRFKAAEYDQALTHFQKCREEMSHADPLWINCLVGLAATYEEQKNLQQAVDTYREALQAATYDYQKIEIMSDLSRVLAMDGRNEEALQVMDQAIKDYPDNPRTGEIIELRAELVAKALGAANNG